MVLRGGKSENILNQINTPLPRSMEPVFYENLLHDDAYLKSTCTSN